MVYIHIIDFYKIFIRKLSRNVYLNVYVLYNFEVSTVYIIDVCMSKGGVAIAIRRRVFLMKRTNYSKIIEDSL